MSIHMQRIYSFVGDDGENVHIDIEPLWQWTQKSKPETYMIPIRRSVIDDIVKGEAVDIKRVIELSKRDHLDPIIMVKDGTFGSNGAPNVLLADGRHRYFLYWNKGLDLIMGHVLEVEQWKPFQIRDIPNITQDQLRRMPVTKRDY